MENSNIRRRAPSIQVRPFPFWWFLNIFKWSKVISNHGLLAFKQFGHYSTYIHYILNNMHIHSFRDDTPTNLQQQTTFISVFGKDSWTTWPSMTAAVLCRAYTYQPRRTFPNPIILIQHMAGVTEHHLTYSSTMGQDRTVSGMPVWDRTEQTGKHSYVNIVFILNRQANLCKFMEVWDKNSELMFLPGIYSSSILVFLCELLSHSNIICLCFGLQPPIVRT